MGESALYQEIELTCSGLFLPGKELFNYITNGVRLKSLPWRNDISRFRLRTVVRMCVCVCVCVCVVEAGEQVGSWAVAQSLFMRTL